MAPARDRLRKAIDQVEFRMPEQPVYANVDASAHDASTDWPDLLGAQLTSPVRWRQTLRQLENDGFTTFVELGPGTVLTGLVKRAVKSGNRKNVSTPGDLDGLLESLSGSKSSDAGVLEGEHLFATERMVVSPSAGIFTRSKCCMDGATIGVGEVLGNVGSQEVVSSFAGQIKGVLAFDGERVTSRQPIAWLRTNP
jgi:[acyl-carrier-protein] S-malonyltransferase